MFLACADPPMPSENSGSDPVIGDTLFFTGAEITYFCLDNRFEIPFVDTISCQENGEWDPPSPDDCEQTRK